MKKNKTKVMTNTEGNVQITTGNTTLEQVSEYVYLGHLIKQNKEAEGNRRMKIGCSVFRQIINLKKQKNTPTSKNKSISRMCTTSSYLRFSNLDPYPEKDNEWLMLHVSVRYQKTNIWIRSEMEVVDIRKHVKRRK